MSNMANKVFYTKKAKAEIRKRRRKIELQKAGGDGDDAGSVDNSAMFAGNDAGGTNGSGRKRTADQISDVRIHQQVSGDGPSSSGAHDVGNEKSKNNQSILTIVIPRNLAPKDAKKFRKDERRKARSEGHSDDQIEFVDEGKKRKEGGPKSSLSSSSSSSAEPSSSVAAEAGKEGGSGNHTARATKDKSKDKKSFPRINDLLSQHAAHQKLQEKLAKQKSANDSLSTAEKRRYVAVDCEMVGIGPEGKKSALARVSVVDWDGSVLLDSFVRVSERVTDFRTRVSGVRPRDIAAANAGAMDHDEARLAVGELLRGKVLVGHALRNDLSVLMLSHPRADVRDTARYAPFMRPSGSGGGKMRPRKLRDLVFENLGRRIQVEGESHCSVDDATATMELFQIVRGRWEKELQQSSSGGKRVGSGIGIGRGKK
jgi:RNA exonuclease 4